MSYVIYALPRSRTKWISQFLTYGDWLCGHDEIMHLRSMDDLASWLAMHNTGSVETAASPYWRLANNLKTVVIRRPVADVIDSLANVGILVDPAFMRRLDAKLDQITHRVPGVLSIKYEELKSEDICKKLFEFCLPYEHDTNWWRALDQTNLQIDILHMQRYYMAHEKQLVKMAQIAKHKIMSQMRPMDVDHDDGLTIQQETFENWYRDAQGCFREHLAIVGESPEAFSDKNLALFRRMDEIGALQITTARSNGRIFGYLLAVISPSIESDDTLTGLHTAFFASPEFKGLGLKLQRASIKALNDRGVEEIHFYAGVRGEGPRMGTIYRRLGAVNNGQLYKLTMQS